MQDLAMSRRRGNRNVAILMTSGLCSNSVQSRLPGNGKAECWRGDTRKMPAAKAGNTAIHFRSDAKRDRSQRLGNKTGPIKPGAYLCIGMPDLI